MEMMYIAEYYISDSKTIKQEAITAANLDEAIDKAQELAGATITLVNVEIASDIVRLA